MLRRKKFLSTTATAIMLSSLSSTAHAAEKEQDIVLEESKKEAGNVDIQKVSELILKKIFLS